jgi:hypothetical protein
VKVQVEVKKQHLNFNLVNHSKEYRKKDFL